MCSCLFSHVLCMYCSLLIFCCVLLKKFTFFSSMKGYSADGEIRDSKGQIWSQNSEWMRFLNPISLPPNHVPTEIPQLRF